MTNGCLQWPDKDPDEVLDYDIDWSARMAAGETFSSVVWDIDPTTTPALTEDSSTFDNPSQTVTIWLSGGLDGTNYEINCHIVADTGREYNRTVGLNVREQQL